MRGSSPANSPQWREFLKRREGMLHALGGGLWLHRHVYRGEPMAHLVSSDRELLVLRNLERLSTAETAAVLGISEGAAKTRHFRALARLQHQLGNNFSGE